MVFSLAVFILSVKCTGVAVFLVDTGPSMRSLFYLSYTPDDGFELDLFFIHVVGGG